jgi:WD40 repeat protein
MDNDSHLITLWQPQTGKEVGVLKDHTNPVWSLAFSKDGNRLISISCPIGFAKGRVKNDRGGLFLWDVGTKQKLATLESEKVSGAVFSHDGKRMVTSGSANDGTIKLWNLHDNLAATVDKVLVEGQGCCLAVAPDGKSFVTAPVSGWSSVATVWDFDTGMALGQYEHKTASVRCLAFSPDGKTLVTGGWTTTDKGAPRKKGEAHPEADLAGELKFWDVATGEEKQTLNQRSPVTSLAFSPNATTLAVGLLHDDKLRLKAVGGFEPPPEKQKGTVVLLTRGRQ